MTVDRLLPTHEAAQVLKLAEEIARDELAPVASEHERASLFPRDAFRLLGKSGLLGLPYPERLGGGGQPYEVYLQVLEVLGSAWASVAVGASVHSLTCFPLAHFGTPDQQAQWLPDMLGGELLGAYCLSEPDAGSDPAAMTTRATAEADGWRLDGLKAWVTHGGEADFYTTFAVSGGTERSISCFLVPADADGLEPQRPEDKMGLTASTTAAVRYGGVRVAANRLVGLEGQGLTIALAALDAGRLGIAAVAVGLAQAALDEAVGYAKQRKAFGKRILDHQGLAFVIADMQAAVQAARASYLDAARRKDAGLAYSKEAAIAKLVATDAAMRVTTDAVQVHGGYGYTRDFPVERYMREAKVMQIFEGTNQIQRLVISRHLARSSR